MSIETVTLLTQNPGKIRAAQQVLNEFDIEVASFEPDLPEIQAASSLEIARFAVTSAFNELNRPVLREDHSFYIADLGIPGPFMSYADKKISAEQLIKIVDTLDTRDAYFEIAAAYMSSNGLYESVFQVPVEIAEKPAGDTKFNWERVMRLPGESTTFAQTPSSERDHLWQVNFRRVAEHIRSNLGNSRQPASHELA